MLSHVGEVCSGPGLDMLAWIHKAVPGEVKSDDASIAFPAHSDGSPSVPGQPAPVLEHELSHLRKAGLPVLHPEHAEVLEATDLAASPDGPVYQLDYLSQDSEWNWLLWMASSVGRYEDKPMVYACTVPGPVPSPYVLLWLWVSDLLHVICL